eukprot:RCo024817
MASSSSLTPIVTTTTTYHYSNGPLSTSFTTSSPFPPVSGGALSSPLRSFPQPSSSLSFFPQPLFGSSSTSTGAGTGSTLSVQAAPFQTSSLTTTTSAAPFRSLTSISTPVVGSSTFPAMTSSSVPALSSLSTTGRWDVRTSAPSLHPSLSRLSVFSSPAPAADPRWPQVSTSASPSLSTASSFLLPSTPSDPFRLRALSTPVLPTSHTSFLASSTPTLVFGQPLRAPGT